MAKEDSRAEIEQETRTLEEQLETELNKEEPNMSEIDKLRDLIEGKEIELSELDINSVTDEELETEKIEEEKEEIEEEKEEVEGEKEEVEEEKEEPEIIDMGKIYNDEINEEKSSDGRYSMNIWLAKSGIDIAASEKYIINKYNKPDGYSREEFIEELKKEDAPKVIKEAGTAIEFLKSPDDWDAVKTSPDQLRIAMQSNDGKLPINNLNENSYVLMIPDDKLQDTTGNGEIEVGDFKKIDKIENVDNKIEKKIPSEVLSRYQVLKVQEIKWKERQNRATSIMAIGAITGNQAMTVAGGIRATRAKLIADQKAAELGKIEDEYTPEELEKGTSEVEIKPTTSQ